MHAVNKVSVCSSAEELWQILYVDLTLINVLANALWNQSKLRQLKQGRYVIFEDVPCL